MRFARYFFLLLCITGCGQATLSDNISKISDNQLIDSATALRRTESEKTAILQELESRHPQWNWPSIHNGRIEKAMCPAEVLLAKGKPYKTTTSARGSQWIYRSPKLRQNRQYVLVQFRENRVLSWRETK